jgi:hypothetical protein
MLTIEVINENCKTDVPSITYKEALKKVGIYRPIEKEIISDRLIVLDINKAIYIEDNTMAILDDVNTTYLKKCKFIGIVDESWTITFKS